MRVLTYEEINGERFKKDNRFELADRILDENLDRLCSDGIIYGAFRYGSASFDDTTPGSDRDLIIAFEGLAHHREAEVLEPLHEMAKEVYRETGVPLEIICASLQQFKDGEHRLTGPMLQWLKSQASQSPDDCFGQDFVHTIADKRRPPQTDFTDVEAFLANSHHTLQKTYLQGYYPNPQDILGFVFSFPHISGRKVIDALETHRFVGRGTLASLAKGDIEQALQGIYDPRARLPQLYTEITKDMQTYNNDFLPYVQAGKLTRDEYDQILIAVIEDNLPKAIELSSLMQVMHRCMRAHFRITLESSEREAVEFTQGDENNLHQPFLPEDLRAVMQPNY